MLRVFPIDADRPAASSDVDALRTPERRSAADVTWSAAVINYNGGAELVGTIASLKGVHSPPGEILVVDDGSTDGSLDFAREAHPDIRVVELGRNTGRTSMVRNAGLRAARNRHVLITDNDIIFAPDAVDRMLEAMLKDPDIGACTPVVLFDDRKNEICNRGHHLHYLCWSAAHTGLVSEASEIAGPVLGCGIQLLDRDKALALGGFDENLYIGWGDDGELHHRLNMVATPCCPVPEARVYHARVRSSQRRFAQVHNRLSMIAKCYATRTLVVLAPALIAFEGFLALYMHTTGSGRDYRRAVAEVWARRRPLMAERRALQARRRRPDRELMEASSIALAPRGRGASGSPPLLAGAFRLYWTLVRPLV